MKIKTLEELLRHTVQDLYSAEKQVTKSLPKMAKKAKNPELKKGFEKHLAETEIQIQRLEKAMEELGIRPKRAKCKGMEGIIKEGDEMLRDLKEPVLDAGLIAAAQKVEHYEISTYGCAITYAKELGNSKVEKLLKESLAEEELTDKKLSEVAQKGLNNKAK